MKKFLLVLFLPILISACSEPVSEPLKTIEVPTGLTYPVSETVDHVDNYHRTEVADRYRWLEDDVRESEAVHSWVGAQNEVTFAYLDTIPERVAIKQRMRELWDYERYSIPDKEGDRYFYSYNNGLQNQNVIFKQEGLDAEPELLIDLNTWSEDGTVALASYSPSPDGSHVDRRY